MIVDVYCGIHRANVVQKDAKIIGGVALSIPCLECGGSGIWDFFPEEIRPCPCNQCKGTGVQYLGM